MLSRKRVVMAWMALQPLSMLLLALAGCRHSIPEHIGSQPISDPSFVGNEACKPCHAAEFTAHHLSFHDTTMRTATSSDLGEFMPPLGVIPLAGYAIEKDKDGNSLKITRGATNGISAQTQKLDLVLGSADIGMTYVSIVDDDSLMETKMSYFPRYKAWNLTPGQEIHIATDTPFGRTEATDAARKCLGCHSTTLPVKGKGIEPERKFFGVGCESCHGPGKDHVAAMQTGHLDDLHIKRLGTLSPSQLNDACGKCHRTASDVDLDSPEVTLTHRFQPYALVRSACRTKTNEPLSCLYCHDPHTNVSHNLAKYEAVCLTCHSAGRVASNHLVPVSVVDARKSKVCPVNAVSGCTGCHMRPKTLFPMTSIPAKMVDHLITPPGAERQRFSPRIDPSTKTF